MSQPVRNTDELPAGPVDRPVGPRAWVIFADNGNCRMWTTFQPHIQKAADAEGLTVTPLFDQSAIDAYVAAERERLKADAADWGNALNEASWALVDAYRRHTGEVESALFFNHGKSILRDALTAYFRALGPNTPNDRPDTADKE